MAKVNKVRRRSVSRHHKVNPYPLPSCRLKVLGDVHQKKKCSKVSEKKDWEDAICSVCMEYPHNAVLLLCSSYNKGCRPYMCATSYRYSNCLEQYKNAYTKVTSTRSAQSRQESRDDPHSSSGIGWPHEKREVSELLCPLCRGQVKGWTVVEPARKYLNTKKRTCMQDNCSFVGTYKELRKHVRAQHPWARPCEVDPSLAEKWKKLEHERELNDVFSTIRSTMPGAIVMGDYVIEGNYRRFSRDYDVEDYLDDALFRLESYGEAQDDHILSDGISDGGYGSRDEEDFGIRRAIALAAPGHRDNYISSITRQHSRLLLGGSRRRRRHRAANGARRFT
ncbi:unnamed protein product [Ilex paraguariensis]|uniref:Uncharacterized protein n=1 Tax=Ilex paraguariensis TaxID=185542 RepID=A0ABC8TIB6_9AQUA